MKTIEQLPVRVRISSILRKAIYSGEYKAGQELSLTEVSSLLGVSRTPVREAFQELASDGLITLRMNRGAIVNAIDGKFIKDNFEMRILLESQAAALAAENGMDVSHLLIRLYHMRDNIAFVDKDTYELLNLDIHTGIWDAADNRKLKSFLMDLWNGPSTGHALNDVRKHYELSTAEHIDILKALKDRDAEKARYFMEQHIKRSMENIMVDYEEIIKSE